jgi:hypothetical protein
MTQSLAGLRVVQDRVRGVNRMLGVDVSTLVGVPVLLEPCPEISFTINCAAHLLAPHRQ